MEKKDLESMLAEVEKQESLFSMQGVKEALAGRSGTLVEDVDGKNATVYCAPLNAYPHTWAAVIVVP